MKKKYFFKEISLQCACVPNSKMLLYDKYPYHCGYLLSLWFGMNIISTIVIYEGISHHTNCYPSFTYASYTFIGWLCLTITIIPFIMKCDQRDTFSCIPVFLMGVFNCFMLVTTCIITYRSIENIANNTCKNDISIYVLSHLGTYTVLGLIGTVIITKMKLDD